MIGNRVKAYLDLIKSDITGTIIEEGCFPNSYWVEMDNVLLPINGNREYVSKLVFFDDELTKIN
jgi:hypothetical protein